MKKAMEESGRPVSLELNVDSFFTCNGKGSFDQEAPQKNYTTLDQRRITCKYFYFVELIIIFNHL